MSDQTTKLDLRKKVILNLKKTKGIDGEIAYVLLVLDRSGSMDKLYNNGTVQQIVERVLPMGMAFDDNQEVDLYVFHDKCYKHKNSISVSRINDIVPEVMGTYNSGGTSYAPAINMILDEWVGEKKSSGMFGLGKVTRPKQHKMKYPAYVIYITDGENSDSSETENALIEASAYPIFFQFIGIGNESFRFLRKLDNLDGRVVDNANFFSADDITHMSDNDLYGKLMSEFPCYLKEIKSKGII